MGQIKVVHVHLIFEKKDFYFGSLSAVLIRWMKTVSGSRKAPFCTPKWRTEASG